MTPNQSVLPRRMEKRGERRHPTPPKFVTAVWLDNGEQRNTKGYLTDLSAGGFSAMLEKPIAKGRLCRIVFNLGIVEAEDLGVVTAGVRVAKCAYDEPYHKLGFQFESITPPDLAKVKKAIRFFEIEYGLLY